MMYYTPLHLLGVDLQLGISLEIIVFFVSFVLFVDEMIFLGLMGHSFSEITLVRYNQPLITIYSQLEL